MRILEIWNLLGKKSKKGSIVCFSQQAAEKSHCKQIGWRGVGLCISELPIKIFFEPSEATNMSEYYLIGVVVIAVSDTPYQVRRAPLRSEGGGVKKALALGIIAEMNAEGPEYCDVRRVVSIIQWDTRDATEAPMRYWQHAIATLPFQEQFNHLRSYNEKWMFTQTISFHSQRPCCWNNLHFEHNFGEQVFEFFEQSV